MSKFHFDLSFFLKSVHVKYIWVLVCASKLFETVLSNPLRYPGQFNINKSVLPKYILSLLYVIWLLSFFCF